MNIGVLFASVLDTWDGYEGEKQTTYVSYKSLELGLG